METKCQIDQCERSVACLCRHCHRDLCFKHFAEHQKQMNDQLILLADRLNQREIFFFSNDLTTKVFEKSIF